MALLSTSFGELSDYLAPEWLTSSKVLPEVVPQQRISLGRFPTPVHQIHIPNTENYGFHSFIKRDDLSSFDLSGNKVRKLEFLLAEAKNSDKNYDCVITIGGLQSNHARATAVAARQIGLDSFLILAKPLPTNDVGEDEDMGLTGNLLFDRIVGADIRLTTLETFASVGGPKLCEQLANELRAQGRNPFIIPLGGSNTLGAFGYLQCVDEIISSGQHFDHIVMAIGSGGSAVAVALGVRLAGLNTQVHAVGVRESPAYFYHHAAEVAEELGLSDTLGPIEDLLHIYDGQGLGYTRSTEEELSYIIKLAQSTGIIVDPVYFGKGLYHFVHQVLPAKKDQFLPGQNVLFIHTGGTVALYNKESEIVKLLPAGKISRISSNVL